MAFGATGNAKQATAFYSGILGLSIRSDDAFAIVFDANGVELRIQKLERFTPQPFTTLGWQVANIDQVLARLAASNITPERYEWLEQDAAEIWKAPSGARIAWFKDPDGNLLSVAEYADG
ncbi:MAG: VOC family protein [Gemmatimonadales bacterium]